jgi:Asp-tRNA(Asn)/Glu-tRNA(Gln) amidotransferase A subunit family amidase
VSRRGTALFAGAFDHVGPLARSARDLALALDVMQGPDADDPVASRRPAIPTRPELNRGIAGLRIAVADGHFARGGEPEALAAVSEVARALDARATVSIPEAHRARAAAMVITAAEGGQLHLADLRTRADEFDPMTRDRFLAAALLPAAAYVAAQRFRAWYRARVRALFERVDVVLAPTTPYPAPRIGQDRIQVDGAEVPARPTLGLYTQPLSFIGLPVISVPLARTSGLPLGVQLVGAPFQESALLRVAAHLERLGVVAARIA